MIPNTPPCPSPRSGCCKSLFTAKTARSGTSWPPTKVRTNSAGSSARSDRNWVCDPAEGFAFLRQIQPEDDTQRVPRLVRRSALSYDATLLLVCLREEFLRFDTSAEDSRRLVRRREDLRELVGAFLRETNNQVKDVRSLDRAIDRLAELGFLGKMDGDLFEVMRIVKARIGPAELETIRDRLRSHADTRA